MKHTVSACTLWPSTTKLVLLFLSYSAISFAASSSATPATGHFATDRLALLSFKSLMHEDPSGALASWNNESLHICQWRGVTCGNHSHHQLMRVTALNLNSLNLTGSISPSLANLTFLHRLDLSNNRLQGLLPQELGFLSHLRYLSLSYNTLGGMIPISLFHKCPRLQILSMGFNSFRGTIPRNLSNCSQLQYISLVWNMLEGEIPRDLGSLSQLQALHLAHNHLSGSIPTEIGNLTALAYLELQNNNLRGVIPPSIWNLSSLVFLDLQFNNFLGSLPQDVDKNLPHLEHLVLAYNQLYGPLPDSWNLSALTYLDLSWNNFIGVIPPSIWNLSALIILNLQHNQLHGSLPQGIGNNLPVLQQIMLNNNQLYGPLPHSWSDASNLEWIQLNNNNFTGTIPNSFGSLPSLSGLILSSNQLEARNAAHWSFLDGLANCTSLIYLYLSDNKVESMLPRRIGNLSTTLQVLGIQKSQLVGNIPVEIRNLVSLTTLALDYNLLNGTIPSELGSLGSLGVITLSGNLFTGGIPTTLGSLTLLNTLDLSFNELQGIIPPGLGNCTLQILNLASNKLTGVVPKEILSIPTLTMYLDVSNNLLTGSLPLEVGNLKNIQGLYLSNNKLSGQIPNTIGECQVLQNLYLQGNFFNGSIPSSFSQLKGIQELDLSHNNLSGHIPDFFGSFTTMTCFNISYNNFDGEVPKDGIFRNTSGFSILGNNQLCGGVPELHLPPCSSQTLWKKHLSMKIVAVILVTGGFLLFILLISLYAARNWLRQSRRQPSTSPGFKEQNRRVSFVELLRATDGFSPANLIGIGSFGSVYKGNMNWEEHQDVAVKVLNLRQEGATRSFIAECEALRNIRHRNLVKILTSCSSIDAQGNDFKALVFEFLPNGSLDKWLHPEVNEQGMLRMVSLFHRLSISIDVASALDYLHHHGSTPIVHCDLKPSNVLLDHDMIAHVGDFGLARFLKKIESKSSQRSTSSATLKGSIGYAAPEYGMANKVSTQGDVYSYGILLLEMFTGKRPTDNIFNEGLSLHQYVEMALPERVIEIIDPQLLLEGDANHPNANGVTNGINGQTLECITAVLRIGILCSKEPPKERMHMEVVIRELHKVQDAYLRSAHKHSTIINYSLTGA